MENCNKSCLPITALLIESRPIVLVAESKLLTQFGFYVVTAATAEEAMQILEHSPVDLVITDIEMPGMRGDELAYEIHKKYPNMPVIAATTGNLMELAINDKARFHKILTKPLTKEKMNFFSFKRQKEQCMIPTRVKVIEGPNGQRIFLGSAFSGVCFTPTKAELAIFLADYKYHEIAKIMKVSSRITEYYAANMKKKLYCKNKGHLIYVSKQSSIAEQLKKLMNASHLFDKSVSSFNPS